MIGFIAILLFPYDDFRRIKKEKKKKGVKKKSYFSVIEISDRKARFTSVDSLILCVFRGCVAGSFSCLLDFLAVFFGITVHCAGEPC